MNIDFKRDGKNLIVKIDLGANGVRSKSGKSVVLASTNGNVLIPGEETKGTKIGINVYRPIQEPVTEPAAEKK